MHAQGSKKEKPEAGEDKPRRSKDDSDDKPTVSSPPKPVGKVNRGPSTERIVAHNDNSLPTTDAGIREQFYAKYEKGIQLGDGNFAVVFVCHIARCIVHFTP
jgi:hypothetical protein